MKRMLLEFAVRIGITTVIIAVLSVPTLSLYVVIRRKYKFREEWQEIRKKKAALSR